MNPNKLEISLAFPEIHKLLYQAQLSHIDLNERILYLLFAYKKIREIKSKLEHVVIKNEIALDSKIMSASEKTTQKHIINTFQAIEDIFLTKIQPELIKNHFDIDLIGHNHSSFDSFELIKNVSITRYHADDFDFINHLKFDVLYYLISLKNTNDFLWISFPAHQKKYFLKKKSENFHICNLSALLKNYLQNHLNSPIEEIFEFRLNQNLNYELNKWNHKNQKNLAKKFSFLETNKIKNSKFLNKLMETLKLEKMDVFQSEHALFIDDLYEIIQNFQEHLPIKLEQSIAFKPTNFFKSDYDDKFQILLQKDILFHHPYQPYTEIIDLFQTMARHPEVERIQITLYHIEENSKIIDALIQAALMHKTVEVYVEVKIDDDIEKVYQTIDLLKKNQVKVFFNHDEPRIHSKMCLISFNQASKIKAISLLSSGNFHEKNSKTYADFSLVTSHSGINEDLKKIFDYIFYQKTIDSLNHVMFSPFNLRPKLISLINEAKEAFKAGEEIEIFLKTKTLSDSSLIEEISQLNCPIHIFFRNYSQMPAKNNIKQYCFLGKYLEHHRVYYFKIGQVEKLFVGSATLAEKNIDLRLELIFPIYEKEALNQIKDEIIHNIHRNHNSCWKVSTDGEYFQMDDNIEDFQTYLIKKYIQSL